jgi:hypothetical protein
MYFEKLEIDQEVVNLCSAIFKSIYASLKNYHVKSKYTLHDFNQLKVPITKIGKDYGSVYPPNSLVQFSSDGALKLKERAALESYMGGQCANLAYMPPRSIMDWHHNNNLPGSFVFYSFAPQQGSIVRFKDPNTSKIIDDIEPAGWSARRLWFQKNNQTLWHCVWSNSTRLSWAVREASSWKQSN